MAWRRPGDKPLSETMMVSSPTHICVTRPQWVNIDYEPFWCSNKDVWEENINAMVADALVLCGSKSSAGMVLTIQDKWVLISQWENINCLHYLKYRNFKKNERCNASSCHGSDISTILEVDPLHWREVTRFSQQMDILMDGWMDGWTRWNFIERGYNDGLIYWCICLSLIKFISVNAFALTWVYIYYICVIVCVFVCVLYVIM